MSNLNFDYIIEASHFNNVIRRIKVYEARPTDQVEALMFAWMLKFLETKRDSLLSQGLNNINPGFAQNQINPSELIKENDKNGS